MHLRWAWCLGDHGCNHADILKSREVNNSAVKQAPQIGGSTVNQIEHWSFADESPDDDLIEQTSCETSSVYGFGHPPYYSNMLDVLQGKDDTAYAVDSQPELYRPYNSARDKPSATTEY